MKNNLTPSRYNLQFITSTLFGFLLLFFWQCKFEQIEPVESTKRPFSVSLDEAVSVAQKFNFLGKDTTIKNARLGAINEVDKAETIFENDQKATTALFHVINYERGAS